MNKKPHSASLKQDIFCLPIGQNFMIYSPLRDLAALVNKKAVDAVKQYLEKGFLNQNKEQSSFNDLFYALRTTPVVIEESSLPFDPHILGIIPTRACNLECSYCNFGAKESDKKIMDIHMATHAVEWMTRQMLENKRHELNVHFFGGEPFIADDIIDVVVHKARMTAARHGLTPYFEASTNGVFDEQRARFIGEYFNSIVLSFDGFEKFHDRQRSMPKGRGSFSAVEKTARYLSQSEVELCLRICVTNENLASLEEIVKWFATTFDPSIICIETLKPTPSSRMAGLTPPDPFDFAVRCVRSARILQSLQVDAVYSAANISSLRHSFCPVGRDAAIFSPDGRISSCYLPEKEWQARGLDMNIGAMKGADGILIDHEAVSKLRRLVKEKPRCLGCFCRFTCAGGCHVTETYPQCSPDYTPFCIQTRLITACFLLDRLDLGDKADQLLKSRMAMESLALQGEDRLLPPA